MTAPNSALAALPDTRRRIADVAEGLFRTLGYQKTTVADIARELGMSPANVYRFYASKSAINEAIADRLLDQLAAGGEAIAAGPGSAEARLYALADHFHIAIHGLFFHERRMHDMVTAAMTEHWGVIERFLQRYLAMVGKVVAEGMAAGAFAPGDPAPAALAFKHAMLAWHHPLMLQECLRMGIGLESQRESLHNTLRYMIAGMKRGLI
jgi:AcrR family transcriptional regulator